VLDLEPDQQTEPASCTWLAECPAGARGRGNSDAETARPRAPGQNPRRGFLGVAAPTARRSGTDQSDASALRRSSRWTRDERDRRRSAPAGCGDRQLVAFFVLCARVDSRRLSEPWNGLRQGETPALVRSRPGEDLRASLIGAPCCCLAAFRRADRCTIPRALARERTWRLRLELEGVVDVRLHAAGGGWILEAANHLDGAVGHLG
jgi:hypothetical protein